MEFVLSLTQDAQDAKSFFVKALCATAGSAPRVINVDKNAAYSSLSFCNTAFCC
jgi:IS6 family transposase